MKENSKSSSFFHFVLKTSFSWRSWRPCDNCISCLQRCLASKTCTCVLMYQYCNSLWNLCENFQSLIVCTLYSVILINNILVQALKCFFNFFLNWRGSFYSYTSFQGCLKKFFWVFLVHCHIAYFSSWIRKDHYCKQRLINYIDTKAFVLFS